MKWLFDHSARNWVAQDKRAYLFKGLQLFAMDGTTLRTHDTEKNREHFGAQGYASGTVASYPQVRGVTLTALPTHLVHSAAFGPYSTNEMIYAKQLIEAIPEQSLTVFDRGFLSAEILCSLTDNGAERHFLIPAKSNTTWEKLEGSDNDAIVRMRVSPQARKKSPELPEFWEARAITVVDAPGAQTHSADLTARPSALQARRHRYLVRQALGNRDKLSGTQADHAWDGTDLAVENGGRDLSGNLGHADRLQPHPP